MKKPLFFLLPMIIIVGFLFPQENPTGEKLFRNLLKVAKSIEKMNAPAESEVGNPGLKRKIIRLLRRSAKFSENKDQKDYLLSLIPGLRKNGKLNCELFPGDNNKYDILFLKNGDIGKCSPVILKTDSDITLYLRKFLSSVKSLVGKGMMKRGIRFFPENIYMTAAEIKYPKTSTRMQLIYSYKKEKERQYPIIFLMTDNLKNKFENKIYQVVNGIISKKEKKYIDFKSFVLGIALHKTSHFLAPVIVKKDSIDKKDNKDILKTPMEELKEYFQAVEETRADMEMMNMILLLAKEKYSDEKTAKRVILTSVLSKIAGLKNGAENKPELSSVFQLNSFFKDGGLTVNLMNGKLKVDMNILKKSILKLNKLFLDFEIKGKYEECRKYFENNGDLSDRVKALVKLL